VRVDIVPCVESQENEDSKARKSQVDRECYEKLSREKKDERNRKDRERRLKTKALAIKDGNGYPKPEYPTGFTR
jgi:hypothetical protein